jgi:hypothetical protein
MRLKRFISVNSGNWKVDTPGKKMTLSKMPRLKDPRIY